MFTCVGIGIGPVKVDVDVIQLVQSLVQRSMPLSMPTYTFGFSTVSPVGCRDTTALLVSARAPTAR